MTPAGKGVPKPLLGASEADEVQSDQGKPFTITNEVLYGYVRVLDAFVALWYLFIPRLPCTAGIYMRYVRGCSAALRGLFVLCTRYWRSASVSIALVNPVC